MNNVIFASISMQQHAFMSMGSIGCYAYYSTIAIEQPDWIRCANDDSVLVTVVTEPTERLKPDHLAS